jgi:hypothetical protein
VLKRCYGHAAVPHARSVQPAARRFDPRGSPSPLTFSTPNGGAWPGGLRRSRRRRCSVSYSFTLCLAEHPLELAAHLLEAKVEVALPDDARGRGQIAGLGVLLREQSPEAI